MSKTTVSIILSKIDAENPVTIETVDQEAFVISPDEDSGAYSIHFIGEDCARKYLGFTDGLQQPYTIACDFSGIAASYFGQTISVGDRLCLIPATGLRSRTGRISCIMMGDEVVAGIPLETAADRHSNWTLLGILGILLMIVGIAAIAMFEARHAGTITMVIALGVIVAGLVGRSKYSWARPYTSLVP